jgi:hypothetical protein
MRLQAENVQEELSNLMDRYTGAMSRVVGAYAAHRNRERDITWVALQATKEYGAMRLHAWAMFRKAKEMEPLQNIRKSCEDSFEEAEHYWGLMKILDWYLEGKPCEVKEMWGYGDFTDINGPGPGMKESLWPESYRYFALAQKQQRETASHWVREVIKSNVEGAAVAFHHLLSLIPPTDEFLKRVTEHERSIADDERHHGPQMIRQLARTAPSEKELDEAEQKILELRVQELRQRNEQFLHPLNAAEMKQLEQDYRSQQIQPISLFGAVAA